MTEPIVVNGRIRCPMCHSAMTLSTKDKDQCLVCGYDSDEHGWRKIV